MATACSTDILAAQHHRGGGVPLLVDGEKGGDGEQQRRVVGTGDDTWVEHRRRGGLSPMCEKDLREERKQCKQ